MNKKIHKYAPLLSVLLIFTCNKAYCDNSLNLISDIDTSNFININKQNDKYYFYIIDHPFGVTSQKNIKLISELNQDINMRLIPIKSSMISDTSKYCLRENGSNSCVDQDRFQVFKNESMLPIVITKDMKIVTMATNLSPSLINKYFDIIKNSDLAKQRQNELIINKLVDYISFNAIYSDLMAYSANINNFMSNHSQCDNYCKLSLYNQYINVIYVKNTPQTTFDAFYFKNMLIDGGIKIEHQRLKLTSDNFINCNLNNYIVLKLAPINITKPELVSNGNKRQNLPKQRNVAKNILPNGDIVYYNTPPVIRKVNINWHNKPPVKVDIFSNSKQVDDPDISITNN